MALQFGQPAASVPYSVVTLSDYAVLLPLLQLLPRVFDSASFVEVLVPSCPSSVFLRLETRTLNSPSSTPAELNCRRKLSPDGHSEEASTTIPPLKTSGAILPADRKFHAAMMWSACKTVPSHRKSVLHIHSHISQRLSSHHVRTWTQKMSSLCTARETSR